MKSEHSSFEDALAFAAAAIIVNSTLPLSDVERCCASIDGAMASKEMTLEAEANGTIDNSDYACWRRANGTYEFMLELDGKPVWFLGRVFSLAEAVEIVQREKKGAILPLEKCVISYEEDGTRYVIPWVDACG